jgi:hypothetical protein
MKMIRTRVAEFCPSCSKRKPIDLVDLCVRHLLPQYFREEGSGEFLQGVFGIVASSFRDKKDKKDSNI